MRLRLLIKVAIGLNCLGCGLLLTPFNRTLIPIGIFTSAVVVAVIEGILLWRQRSNE